MWVDSFLVKIEGVLRQNNDHGNLLPHHQEILNHAKEIISRSKKNPGICLTELAILFEGLYQSTDSNSLLRQNLLKLRLELWKNHFGCPTVTFLLSYKKEIDALRDLMKEKVLLSSISPKPWEICPDKNQGIDANSLFVNPSSVSEIPMPEEEKLGHFIKTFNPLGGFTTVPCDAFSQEFISYAKEVSKTGGNVLEIGAGFGAASLSALAQGANVFCNDIDPTNLAVVKNRRENLLASKSIASNPKLVLIPGCFPEELSELPKGFFDAILLCRVLHFFSGEKISKSLEQLATFLKPGGKLFIVCETPFLKNWQSFLPEYEKRIERGDEWPGEISNPAYYESSGRAATLPKFVHWMTKETLNKSVIRSKLGIERLSYIDRKGQFPNDLLLDGRESVGVVACKNKFSL